MREIKFRGKSVWSNEWVCGNGAHNGTGSENYIHTVEGMIQTHEGSNGQFTGLKDKNDKEIYEGDILKFEHLRDYANELQVVSMEKFIWGTDEYGFQEMIERNYKFEVIGNIFENPELLEVEGE